MVQPDLKWDHLFLNWFQCQANRSALNEMKMPTNPAVDKPKLINSSCRAYGKQMLPLIFCTNKCFVFGCILFYSKNNKLRVKTLSFSQWSQPLVVMTEAWIYRTNSSKSAWKNALSLYLLFWKPRPGLGDLVLNLDWSSVDPFQSRPRSSRTTQRLFLIYRVLGDPSQKFTSASDIWLGSLANLQMA